MASERKPREQTFATERRFARLALGVGIVLLGVKFFAYYLTGSAAIFTDAAESIVNVLAAGFALWAIGYAHQPADASHPYGHGKMEFMSALLEGSMILVAALAALWRALETVWQGPEVESIGLGLILVVFAGVANGGLGLVLIRKGKASGSITLEADGRHLLTDAVTSVVLLITLVAIWLSGVAWLDPIGAVVLAIYLGWEGVHLIGRAAAGLMDKQDPDDEKLLTDLLDSHIGDGAAEPKICSYHKLRHRHVGRDHWIDFHLVVPRDWNVKQGHDVAGAIEGELERAFGRDDPEIPGHTNATAHVEPCEDPTCVNCTI